MGIDNAGILCYIGSTEVNRCVPLGQLEPDSMKQPVGFFFISPMLCAGITISKSAASCLCRAWGGFPFHLFPLAGSPPGPQAEVGLQQVQLVIGDGVEARQGGDLHVNLRSPISPAGSRKKPARLSPILS